MLFQFKIFTVYFDKFLIIFIYLFFLFIILLLHILTNSLGDKGLYIQILLELFYHQPKALNAHTI